MKRILSLLPLSVTIAFLTLVIAVVIDNYFEFPLVSLQTFTNSVTVVSSILLLAIGFKLYRKFSGTQAIIDKQTAVIIELSMLLSEARFQLKRVDKKGKEGSGLVNLNINSYKTHIKSCYNIISENEYSTKELYIDASITDFLTSFWKLKDNPYLPKQIAFLLRNDFGMMTQASISKSDVKRDYLELQTMHKAKTNELLWQPSNIYDVMKNMKNVHGVCNGWLKEHNLDAFETLNIS